MRQEKPIECTEVVGKTLKALHVYRNGAEGTEVSIDFMDGTNFSCNVIVTQHAETTLSILKDAAEPDVLARFE